MKQTVKKVWSTITSAAVTLVVLAALGMAGVRLAGLQMFTVLSGSMEPEYPVGALLCVRPVDCRSLQCGDVITFHLTENTVATHRIVEVLPNENDPSAVCFRTKGDANAAVDGQTVSADSVIGMPVLTIPLLGYAIAWMQHPPGSYAMIGVGVAVVLLALAAELLPSLSADEKRTPNKTEKDCKSAQTGAKKP